MIDEELLAAYPEGLNQIFLEAAKASQQNGGSIQSTELGRFEFTINTFIDRL